MAERSCNRPLPLWTYWTSSSRLCQRFFKGLTMRCGYPRWTASKNAASGAAPKHAVFGGYAEKWGKCRSPTNPHAPTQSDLSPRMAPSLSLLFCVAALGSLLVDVSVGGSAGGSSRGALALPRRRNGRRLHHVAPPPQAAASTRVAGLRGGSTATGEEREAGAGVVRSMKVLVSTTKISSFVDAVREMQVSSVRTRRHKHVCASHRL